MSTICSPTTLTDPSGYAPGRRSEIDTPSTNSISRAAGPPGTGSLATAIGRGTLTCVSARAISIRYSRSTLCALASIVASGGRRSRRRPRGLVTSVVSFELPPLRRVSSNGPGSSVARASHSAKLADAAVATFA